MLSGLRNGATLLVVAAVVMAEAVRRVLSPPEMAGSQVVWTALAGVAVNLAATCLLAKPNRAGLNACGACRHLLADLYGFAGTTLAGVVIVAAGWGRPAWRRRSSLRR